MNELIKVDEKESHFSVTKNNRGVVHYFRVPSTAAGDPTDEPCDSWRHFSKNIIISNKTISNNSIAP